MFYSYLKLVYRVVTRKLIDTFTLVVEEVFDELLEFARNEDTTVVISTSTIMDKMKYKLRHKFEHESYKLEDVYLRNKEG